MSIENKIKELGIILPTFCKQQTQLDLIWQQK